MDVLLQSQRNAIFEKIRESGLEPSDFSWSNQSLLRHCSGYYFAFNISNGIRTSNYSPGYSTVRQQAAHNDWWEQLESVQNWLNNLKRELSQPDFWTELKKASVLPSSGDSKEEDRPFAPDERKAISKALKEVLEYCRANYRMSADRLDALESRFRYLEDASERLTIKDWKAAVVGTLVTAILGGVLPQDAFQQAIVTIGRIVFPGLAALTSLPQ